MTGMGRWLDVGEPIREVDYVMVLPGAVETRTFVATAMMRHGLAKGVLVPKTVDAPVVQDGIIPPYCELTRRVLELRGVAEDEIHFLEVITGSSWNDAQALEDFLRDKPDVTVAVVTSDYHTRRARWVFRKVLPAKRGQLCFVSAPEDYYGPEDWWERPRGVKRYVGEYLKFAAYLVVYGKAWVWMALFTVLFVLRKKIWTGLTGLTGRLSRSTC